MKISPFHERRRQQFLYEELYEKTRINLIALAKLQIEERKSAESADDISLSHQFLYLETFWLWMLDYTAGTSIEELARRVVDLVDKFEAWNDADQAYQKECSIKFPEYGQYTYHGAPDFSTTSDYIDTMQLLSIVILIRDQQSVIRIIHILRSHRGLDGLFEKLISSYVDNEIDIDIDIDFCILGNPFDLLLQTFYDNNEKLTLDLLREYVRQWYPAMKDHPRWYDGHLRIREEGYAPYYGYWAFEAAATAFLLNVDDSTIDHMVYPKELVCYGRRLREERRHTSVATAQPIKSKRIEGGQPCPQTGYWETPAKLHSRRHFEQGDSMPVFDDAPYGETIWQWSVEQ